jgi:hypothetical protein
MTYLEPGSKEDDIGLPDFYCEIAIIIQKKKRKNFYIKVKMHLYHRSLMINIRGVIG